MKVPVSWEEFKKNRVTAFLYILIALLFVAFTAVGYLYIDNKQSDREYRKQQQITNQEYRDRIIILEKSYADVQEKLRKSDSLTAAYSATLKLLERLGKIDNYEIN